MENPSERRRKSTEKTENYRLQTSNPCCVLTLQFSLEKMLFHIMCPGAFSRPSRYRCHFRLSKISTQPTDDKRRKFTCAQQRREEKKFSSRLRSFAFDNFPGGGFFSLHSPLRPALLRLLMWPHSLSRANNVEIEYIFGWNYYVSGSCWTRNNDSHLPAWLWW